MIETTRGMTREIKFRDWVHQKMIMIYFDFWSDVDAGYHIRTGHMINEETVMQYTGLKDKNGKEIYEGDIVDCGNGILREIKCFGPVYYGVTPGGDLCMLIESNNFKESEVIGNIYENPKLLET